MRKRQLYRRCTSSKSEFPLPLLPLRQKRIYLQHKHRQYYPIPRRHRSILPVLCHCRSSFHFCCAESVLKSKTAVEVNINIIRAFVRMRQYLLSNIPKKELEELKQRIEYLEEDITSDRESYEKQFDDLFNAFAKISAIIQSRQTPLDRVKIEGFKNK